MGLLDWFRKRRPKVPLPQLCYDLAYFVLPHYAHHDLARLVDLRLSAPTAAGPFFYVMACRMRQAEPDMEAARRLRWHHGDMGAGRENFTLEYPTPPPVDLSDVPVEQRVGGGCASVLAPYFSAVVRDSAAGGANYFILGQAPVGGGRTLRSLTGEGLNCNLGGGPEPRLEASLEALDGGLQVSACGAGELSVGEGLLDLVGVLVGGLAGATGLVGLLGDGTVPAAQDGGGVADPGGTGNLGMGGATGACGV